MSILKQTINLEKPVTLTILKRGGADHYKQGKIVVETDKAILVQFKEENKECWISKRNVYDNEEDYGVKAKLWNAWERVYIKELGTEIMENGPIAE